MVLAWLLGVDSCHRLQLGVSWMLHSCLVVLSPQTRAYSKTSAHRKEVTPERTPEPRIYSSFREMHAALTPLQGLVSRGVKPSYAAHWELGLKPCSDSSSYGAVDSEPGLQVCALS